MSFQNPLKSYFKSRFSSILLSLNSNPLKWLQTAPPFLVVKTSPKNSILDVVEICLDKSIVDMLENLEKRSKPIIMRVYCEESREQDSPQGDTLRKK